jgi:hypothetical protein
MTIGVGFLTPRVGPGSAPAEIEKLLLSEE